MSEIENQNIETNNTTTVVEGTPKVEPVEIQIPTTEEAAPEQEPIEDQNNAPIGHTGFLGANTPLLLNDENIVTIKDAHDQVQFQGNLNAYQINGDGNIRVTDVSIDPDVTYQPDIYDIEFSNGYHLLCGENTAFKTNDLKSSQDAWKLAKDLIANEDKIVGVEFSPEEGFKTVEYDVTICQHSLGVQQPLYTFTAKLGNLLVPMISEDNDSISFICISQ